MPTRVGKSGGVGTRCLNRAWFAVLSSREIGVDLEAVRASAATVMTSRRAFFLPRERRLPGPRSARQAPGILQLLDAQGSLHQGARRRAFPIRLIASMFRSRRGEPARILRVRDVDGDACGWALYSFDPGPGFVGAVVVRSRVADPATFP